MLTKRDGDKANGTVNIIELRWKWHLPGQLYILQWLPLGCTDTIDLLAFCITWRRNKWRYTAVPTGSRPMGMASNLIVTISGQIMCPVHLHDSWHNVWLNIYSDTQCHLHNWNWTYNDTSYSFLKVTVLFGARFLNVWKYETLHLCLYS